METNTFLPFLFVILAIVIGVAGIVLLIVGLVFSQKKKWIPGLAAFVVSIIIGILGIVFSFKNVINRIEQNKSSFYSNNWQNTVNADSLFQFDSPVDSSYMEAVSGFIEDNNKSLIYTKVFPHKALDVAGISLLGIEKGKVVQNNSVAVKITIDCKKTFSGQLVLAFFEQDKKFIAEQKMPLNIEPSANIGINFQFDKSINFSKADYATLCLIEKQ